MKKIILLLLTFYPVFSQNTLETKIISSVKNIDADFYFGQDSFGYVYYSKNNVLYKSKENETFQFSRLSYGQLSTVDISNPLQILLFYKTTNQIILLDNQLNETWQYTLNQENNFIIPKFIGMGSMNKIWLIDQQNNKIQSLDRNTKNIKFISPSIEQPIKYIQNHLNYLFWIDTDNKIWSCDLFGKISKGYSIPNFDKIFIIDENQLIFSKDNQLFSYKIDTEKTENLNINLKSNSTFYYSNQILTIFTDNQIFTNYLKL